VSPLTIIGSNWTTGDTPLGAIPRELPCSSLTARQDRGELSPGLDDSVWLRQQRLRFIGVDRPGYGNPDPWPEASLPRFCPSPPPFLARFWQSVPSEDPADSSLLSDSSIADL
jgi:hypothetical protein